MWWIRMAKFVWRFEAREFTFVDKARNRGFASEWAALSGGLRPDVAGRAENAGNGAPRRIGSEGIFPP